MAKIDCLGNIFVAQIISCSYDGVLATSKKLWSLPVGQRLSLSGVKPKQLLLCSNGVSACVGALQFFFF